jgi:OOP family OmpA-OmpF porin
MRKNSFVFTLLLSSFFIFAQNESNSKSKKYQDDYSSWSVGLNLGSTFMSGDLKSFNGFESYDYDFDINGGLEFAGGLSVTYMANSWWGLRVSSMYGRTSSLRVFTPDLNYSSQTWVLNSDFSIVLNPINALRITESLKPRRWAFLIMGGVGFNLSQPEFFLNNESQYVSVLDNKTYHTPGYIHFNPELKYSISESFDLDLGFKMTYHYNSDWIDGFNSGSRNDVFSYFYIGATYNFAKNGSNKSLVYSSPLSNIYSMVKDAESKMGMLTADSDGDGVPDFFDKDPNTPEGVAVDGAGRPLDVDMDGIPDYLDADPFTARGAKVDASGNELDSDGDGVPDSKDLEPNTPKGSLVDARGRKIPLGGNLSDAVLPQVFFSFNNAFVSENNKERLAIIARVLQSDPSITLTLVGHTDKVGSEEYNKKLGERRAQAVKDYLVKHFNIDPARLKVESKGKNTPLSNFNTINRRVEFSVN